MSSGMWVRPPPSAQEKEASMEVKTDIFAYNEGEWFGDSDWYGTVKINHRQIYVTPKGYAHENEAEEAALLWFVERVQNVLGP